MNKETKKRKINIKILLKVLSENPRDADAWALIGKILFIQNDISGALTFTRKALSIDSGHFEASELLIKINEKKSL